MYGGTVVGGINGESVSNRILSFWWVFLMTIPAESYEADKDTDIVRDGPDFR